LQCRGFVQIDHSVTFGQSLNNTSTIDGPTFELGLSILQVIPNKKSYDYSIFYILKGYLTS